MDQQLGRYAHAQATGMAAQSGYLQGLAAQNVPQTAPPPPTLARALSSLDELNKRLGLTASQAYQLAANLGGPFPVAGDEAKAQADAEKPTAMRALNELVDAAHQRLSGIEQAIGAMSRSLGAS